MESNKKNTEIITERKSVRSYSSEKIQPEVLEKLKKYLEELNSEAGIKSRILLTSYSGAGAGTASGTGKEAGKEAGEKFGTYGMISGAQLFMVAVVDNEEKDVVRFGYIFEKAILYATELGLGTCWLGGTFNRNDFSKSLNIGDNEFIPIVSPVGYKSERKRVISDLMRAVIKADQRIDWSTLYIDENKVPLTKEMAGDYAIPLEMLRLGPSASNKQPWRGMLTEEAFHLYICRTKGYPSKNFDIQMNDMGIAMCHFELAAKELGLSGEWQKMPETATHDEWEYVISWVRK